MPSDFPLFRPAGAGGRESSERLTRIGINQLVPSLLDLLRSAKSNQAAEFAMVVDRSKLRDSGDDELAESLAKLFQREGSDKAQHGYHSLYARVLQGLKRPTIFELGLGSNNLTVPSNMGSGGSPGASLRAFREALDGARVMGGDVDPNALRGHDFEVFLLDQLDAATFPARDAVGAIDLVIDDGLHMPVSNLNTVSWGLTVLSNRGVIVVEDIPHASLPVWEIVASILSDEFSSGFFRGNSSNAFVTTSHRRFEELFSSLN